MITRLSLFGILGIALAFFALAAPAQAQATRTWVSGVGDDANPCSRTAPCKTFAGAISKTAAGGEINCIDPGGFGAVTITKAMTIDCSFVEAGVLVAGTNGVIVSAGAADVVVLRGLDFIGTVAVPALNGVLFNTGRALFVEKCNIREFTSAAPNGNGILFQPSASSKLFVTDTNLTNNAGSGIMVRPSGAGSANVSVNRTTSANNLNGFSADTSVPTSGTILMSVRDSVASGNTSIGIAAVSSATSGTASYLVDRSSSTLNATGVSTSGAHAAVLVGNSSIWGNSVGVSAAAGAPVLSFGNNQLGDSAGDAFTPPLIALR